MNDREVLEALYATVENRRDNPKEGSYTCYLLDKGIDKILKKVGEECSETIIAAKNDDNSETVYEIADLIYHLTVMMVKLGIPRAGANEKTKRTRRRRTAKIFATKRQRYLAGEDRGMFHVLSVTKAQTKRPYDFGHRA